MAVPRGPARAETLPAIAACESAIESRPAWSNVVLLGDAAAHPRAEELRGLVPALLIGSGLGLV